MALSIFPLTEASVAFFGDNPYRPIDLAVIVSTGGYVQFRHAGVCKRIGNDMAQLASHHPCLDVLHTPDMHVDVFTTNNDIKVLTLFDRTGEVVKVPCIRDCAALHAMLTELVL